MPAMESDNHLKFDASFAAPMGSRRLIEIYTYWGAAQVDTTTPWTSEMIHRQPMHRNLRSHWMLNDSKQQHGLEAMQEYISRIYRQWYQFNPWRRLLQVGPDNEVTGEE